MSQRTNCLALRCITAASVLACAMPAQSTIVTTGSIGVGPVFLPIGPGDTLLPSTAVWVGSPGVGSLTADAGSFLQLARLSFGSGGTGNGTGLISGAGTRVDLLGDGASNSQVQRLMVGDYGTGQLTVNAGAVLDTRGNQAPCLLAFRYCDSFVGGAAGDNGLLNIDGVGTQVRIGQNLFIAQPGLAIQHLDGYTYGVPGGTTRGTVNVTGGALLSTDRAQVGPRHWSTNATRQERNIAEINVSGAGSRWEVVGGSVVNNANGVVSEGGAGILTANDRNAWAIVNVSNGGVIAVQGQPGIYNYINLTNGGGRTDARVTGVGSAIVFSGDAGVLQVGFRLGSASMSIDSGGSASGMFYVSVGRNASFGELVVDGVGSLLRVDGTATAAANTNSAPAYMEIGRNGGNGTVTVSNGGRIEVLATLGATNGTGMGIGRDANSAGTLNIQSAGVVLFRSSSSAPGTAAETANPSVRVGREGSGTLNISGGGKLLLEGGGVSTPTNRRSTNLFIGGLNDTAVGGRGIATVTGAGSEIKLTGQDSFIGVGIGPQSSGQLTVSAGATVSGIGMNVGRSGGVGVLKLDTGHLVFSGQQTAGNLSGAFLGFGSGGTGIGTGLIINGSTVTLINLGTAGAGLSIGGTTPFPGGDGSLTLSGGSSIAVTAAPGLAYLNVGRDGSALLRLRGASSINLGDGVMTLGRLSGGDGTVIVSEASTVTTGWLGVGRNKTATGSVDGGTGTLLLINSTLTAQTIVIGSNGFLGGTGTITGNVTNFGIFAPGNSPGTLEITGAFSAEAGSRLILEVQADGQGGFATDRVIFGAGQALDLAALNVEFRFLGATNPNTFQSSGGFGTNTFFQARGTDGVLGVLAPSVFATASFAATSDAYTISQFSFSAAGGASFTATPVPEPETAAMLIAGLAALGWLSRRRRG